MNGFTYLNEGEQAMYFGKRFAIDSYALRMLVWILAASASAMLGITFAQPAPPQIYSPVTISLSPTNDATGVNAAGEIVGNYGDVNDHGRGYLKRHGIATTINFPGATDTAVFGIN